MGAVQIKFENKEFHTELLDRLLFALHGRMNEMFSDGVETPVTSEKAREYLGNMSKDAFYRLQRAGVIKGYSFPGLSTKFYFRSQLYETLIKKQ